MMTLNVTYSALQRPFLFLVNSPQNKKSSSNYYQQHNQTNSKIISINREYIDAVNINYNKEKQQNTHTQLYDKHPDRNKPAHSNPNPLFMNDKKLCTAGINHYRDMIGIEPD